MAQYIKLRINFCLIIVFVILCCCSCDIDVVGRKTLMPYPSHSLVYSKKIGAYIASYAWSFKPYTKIDVDTLIQIKSAFLEYTHKWYSYDSDSMVCFKNSFDFVVLCESEYNNIIFPNFVYGDLYRKKRMLHHELRNIRDLSNLSDTISTYVVWAPSSHFELGLFSRYKSTLKNGFYDFNDVDAYKKYEPAEGAIVLGLLQFIRIKDEDNE